MGWSAGTFTRAGGSTAWEDDRAGGTALTSALHDTHDEDLTDSGGLGLCITRDGQNSPSADLPMNSKKFINVGDAQARNEYLSNKQFQRSSVIWGGTASFSSDAYAISLSPAITAYTDGMMVIWRSTNANTTTTPTLNVNGVGAVTITQMSGALAAGDIKGTNKINICVFNSTGSDEWQLMNLD